MKKIFMTCYGGGHVEIIKEVYKNLVKISNIEIVILALTTSKYNFNQERIEYKLITDYYDEIKDSEIYELGKEFCIKNSIDTSIGAKETYLYHGYALYELEKKYNKEKVEKAFKKFGRSIFLPIQFMERVLKNENPTLVITTNSPRYEKATLIASKNLNIKSLSIEDLFGKESSNIELEVKHFFNNNMYEKVYGDYVCVLSEITKKNLELYKINKIFVTGNPSFDKTLRFFGERKIKEKAKEENITICYLTQKHPENMLIMRKLIKFIKEKKINLIIKTHPNEKIEDYMKELDSKVNRKIQIENLNLYENISKSDIVITIFSTAGLEAAILDKPVVAKKTPDVPFEKLGIGLEYENISEIEEKINKILNNKENINEKLKGARDKFRPQKKAGEQIKEIVEEILKI
ncbi:hypothetical protein [Fusobacterium massiliense]|uniref:capsular polysaccharide export protein, LipB/KpsS family n=1 Tax=Fusobacterium massiliense TaxID=1852365 RepID=UPI0028D817F1|nr:hypothetical protein [Fusobacterium massiliense]